MTDYRECFLNIHAAFTLAMRVNPILNPNPHRLAACALLVGANRQSLALWALDLGALPLEDRLDHRKGMPMPPRELRVGSGRPNALDKGGRILDVVKAAAVSGVLWDNTPDPRHILLQIVNPEEWAAFQAALSGDWGPMVALAKAWDEIHPRPSEADSTMAAVLDE